MTETTTTAPADTSTELAPERKRLPAGERRLQILQVLAGMLEQPQGERITTASLAAKLEVSEAALYRHFASKAQMFEALIEFIEDSAMGLVRQINERESSGLVKAARMVSSLLQFAEKNPGLSRVMSGDALVLEHARLEARMSALFDKLEAALRQALREAMEAANSSTPTVDAALRANVLCSFLLGRIQRYVRSGFKQKPADQAESALALILS